VTIGQTSALVSRTFSLLRTVRDFQIGTNSLVDDQIKARKPIIKSNHVGYICRPNWSVLANAKRLLTCCRVSEFYRPLHCAYTVYYACIFWANNHLPGAVLWTAAAVVVEQTNATKWRPAWIGRSEGVVLDEVGKQVRQRTYAEGLRSSINWLIMFIASNNHLWYLPTIKRTRYLHQSPALALLNINSLL